MSPCSNGSVEVICEFCENSFNAPHSMEGGLANCPSCEKATKVSGGPEPLFWLICGGVLLGITLFAAIVGYTGGWITGLAVLVVGLIIGGIVLASS